MNKTLMYSMLIAVVAALAATTFDVEHAEHRRPGEEPRESHTRYSKVGNTGDESAEALAREEQFAQARTAPGIVLPGAYSAAFASLSGLPVSGGSWSEVTNRPYNADDPRYRDPFASNSGAGNGFASGRIVGLALSRGYIYIGGADGGVFRSADDGHTWTAMTDNLPTLSVGDVRIAPDGALWLATGEANTGATAFVGSGVYRLSNPTSGVFAKTGRVGGTELESTFIGKLRFDGIGNVYAATSRGVWRHAANTNAGVWTRVLYPVPDPPDPAQQSPYNNICNDVAIQPNSGGRHILANCAWRGGAPYNGFYYSVDGGASFARVNPTGALNPEDVGRTTFAYSSDGSAVYALVESMTKYTNSNQTALSGVYVAPSGDPAGPWNKIAGSGELSSKGSALKNAVFYRPGIQAWYNQFIDVDPADPLHVFVGLEEVYETEDGGSHWTTIGPYWNFDFKCWSVDPARNTCPPTTHSDQHSIATDGARIYVGNDGGLFRRPLRGQVNANGNAIDWENLNANIRTLQYYSVAVGNVPGGVAVSGGMQDNGGSLLLPEDLGNTGVMGSPFGGDGGDSLVDPNDGCKIVQEYVYLAMEVTENCGRSDGTVKAVRDIAPADPFPRFIAPFEADTVNLDHWIAGGEKVWLNTKGFAIQSGADWTPVFDTGAGHSITALASQNDVAWTAWCGPCNPPGFTRGVSTNAGGAWHQLTLPSNVPNRYIAGVAIDSTDPNGNTAYLGFNGFSRVWIEGPGAGLGHLWKTTDAGATWKDVSGTLPDVPVNKVLLAGTRIVLATDLGVVVSADGGAHWSRLGGNLPYTTAMDVHLGPDNRIYAATHGRGIWSIAKP
jgi:hypothetical protein